MGAVTQNLVLRCGFGSADMWETVTISDFLAESCHRFGLAHVFAMTRGMRPAITLQSKGDRRC